MDETTPKPGGLTSRCGAYELVREINRGGTGSVWEGRHVTLGRRVAVKVLHTEHAENPELAARLEREGQAAARIKHPNVAQMLDVGHDAHRLWLVMEFLEGEDLDDLLRREGPLEVERAVDLLLPVVAAVATAHKAGVVHRDLKPGNIFLARDPDGAVVPKVVDFGFSKIHADGLDDGLTRPETSLGTLSYMPVEQLHAAHEARPESDQYAIAVTLYRAVTGRLPFPGKNAYETFKALTTGTFPPPREVAPGLPEALEAVILRGMARLPEGRYPSVRALGTALLPFASPAAQHRWKRAFGVTTPVRAARPSQPPDPSPSRAPAASLLPDAPAPAPEPVTTPVTAPVTAPVAEPAAATSTRRGLLHTDPLGVALLVALVLGMVAMAITVR